ncbi:MAG: cell division protein FtsA [Candidatus Pacebacteria bacterium]|nr:cell division protein FtsA [Candidatus Paceibacterota bacterium]MDD5722017.1 cell division protein FtsA [Candidatus Paceibacterota bacterium]
MKNPFLAIDLGSANIKALVAQVNAQGLNVILPASRKSRGIKEGVPNNLEVVAEELDSLIAEIESMLKNVAFREAVVGIGGSNLETRVSKGTAVVTRPDQEIGEDDIQRANKAAEAFALPPNRTLIQAALRSYIVDGVAKVKDPLGMKGLKIESECLLIDAFSPDIHSIDRLGEMINIKFNPKLILPYAGAEIALTAQDKDLGAIALDLGASTTSFCVYENNEILDLKVFPVGGNAITNDIAVGLKTSVDIAEKIKINEGLALKRKVTKNQDINWATYYEDDSAGDKATRKFLAEIIEARLDEIFDLVAKRLKEINRFEKLPGGVVIYGGGAKMPLIIDLAKERLRLPVRFAKPEIEWYQETSDLSLIPVLGLLLLRAQGQREGFISLEDGVLGKAFRFFKNIFSI